MCNEHESDNRQHFNPSAENLDKLKDLSTKAYDEYCENGYMPGRTTLIDDNANELHQVDKQIEQELALSVWIKTTGLIPGLLKSAFFCTLCIIIGLLLIASGLYAWIILPTMVVCNTCIIMHYLHILYPDNEI